MDSSVNPPIENSPVSTDNTHLQPSLFDGTTLQLLGWRMLGTLLSALTLGIGAPWAHCMILRWETKHTSINGKPLHFDGKGHQLLGKYLLWGLLTLITFGIYAFFIPVRMHKWRVSHTRFAEPADKATDKPSPAVILSLVMTCIAGLLLIILLITVLLPKWFPDLMERIYSKIDPTAENYGDELLDGITTPTPDGTVQFIYNGDGTFTPIIIGKLPEGIEDQTENDWIPDTAPADEWTSDTMPPDSDKADGFTDDSRIIGDWLICESGPVVFMATMLELNADGTFTESGDCYAYSGTGWYAEGLSEKTRTGTYTFRNGQLCLTYTSFYNKPSSGDPDSWGWVSMNKTITQQVTFNSDGTLSFSDLEAFGSGYFDLNPAVQPAYGSISDTLTAYYPSGY